MVVVVVLLLLLNNPFIRMNIKGSFSLPSLTYINLFSLMNVWVHFSTVQLSVHDEINERDIDTTFSIVICSKFVWVFAFGFLVMLITNLGSTPRYDSQCDNNRLAHAYTCRQMVNLYDNSAYVIGAHSINWKHLIQRFFRCTLFDSFHARTLYLSTHVGSIAGPICHGTNTHKVQLS